MRKIIVICLASIALALNALATPHPITLDLSSLMPPDPGSSGVLLPPGSDPLTGGGFSPMVSYPITVIINSNGAPVITGGNTNWGDDFVQSTNPIPYTYQPLQNLGVNDSPILQWVDSQHMIANCNSNEVCYLTGASDLSIPTSEWTILGTVTNGEIFAWPSYISPAFFQLRVITTRTYVQFLQAPGGFYPSAMAYSPFWAFSYGFFYCMTNLNGNLYNMWSNTIVEVYYPNAATNSVTNWPFATVYQTYDNGSGGIGVVSNTITMTAGANANMFSASYVLSQVLGGSKVVVCASNLTYMDLLFSCCNNTNFPLTITNAWAIGDTNNAPTNTPTSIITVTNPLGIVVMPIQQPPPVVSGPGGNPNPTLPYEGPPPNQSGPGSGSVWDPALSATCIMENLNCQGIEGCMENTFPGWFPPGQTDYWPTYQDPYGSPFPFGWK